MVKINGIKARETDESLTMSTKQSMNQILEKMENNFRETQAISQKAQSQNFGPNIFQSFQNSNQNSQNVQTMSSENSASSIFADGGTILSLLPSLLNKDGNKTFGFDNPIFKELLKKSNNPMLQKILEILPLITKTKATNQHQHKAAKKQENETTQAAAIDSYVKTDDFKDT